jgi:hypothetical protein
MVLLLLLNVLFLCFFFLFSVVASAPPHLCFLPFSFVCFFLSLLSSLFIFVFLYSFLSISFFFFLFFTSKTLKSSIVNFDFKNQFNCIPAKFNRRPWSWPSFSL